MVGIKPERCRLTTQQHSQRPVTTPMPVSTTPPGLQIITPKLRLSRPTPLKPEVLFFHELHHQGTEVILCMLLQPTAPRLLAPKYYTTNALEYYTTTYNAPAYYTEVPAYCTTKTVDYYREGRKYYSAPCHTTTTEVAKYYVTLTFFTTTAFVLRWTEILH
jgi:hypothetical protein